MILDEFDSKKHFGIIAKFRENYLKTELFNKFKNILELNTDANQIYPRMFLRYIFAYNSAYKSKNEH